LVIDLRGKEAQVIVVRFNPRRLSLLK
jgi:hypothetical protein